MKIELYCGQADKDRITPYLSHILRMEDENYGTPWSREQLLDTLSYDYNLILVLKEEETACGYLIANLLMDTSELLRITVDREKRGQGFGRSLLTHYLAELRGVCETAMLEVRESNTSARALYERAGYREISKRKSYYKNPAEDAIIYEKELD